MILNGFYGSCVGPTNPGHGGAGILLLNDAGDVLNEKSMYIGEDVTAFYSDYAALLLLLKSAAEHQFDTLNIHGSVLLTVNQVTGQWKIRDDGIRGIADLVFQMLENLSDRSVRIKRIKREENMRAFKLAEQAILPYTEGRTAYYMAKTIDNLRFQRIGTKLYRTISSEPYVINTIARDCTCPEFRKSGEPCEHILAIEKYEALKRSSKTRRRRTAVK